MFLLPILIGSMLICDVRRHIDHHRIRIIGGAFRSSARGGIGPVRHGSIELHAGQPQMDEQVVLGIERNRLQGQILVEALLHLGIALLQRSVLCADDIVDGDAECVITSVRDDQQRSCLCIDARSSGGNTAGRAFQPVSLSATDAGSAITSFIVCVVAPSVAVAFGELIS